MRHPLSKSFPPAVTVPDDKFMLNTDCLNRSLCSLCLWVGLLRPKRVIEMQNCASQDKMVLLLIGKLEPVVIHYTCISGLAVSLGQQSGMLFEGSQGSDWCSLIVVLSLV